MPLNLKGKNRALVGLGSCIVNTGGCNDCHTNPPYADDGDPFQGQKEQINTAGYLAGGQHFGPFVSANITPDASGRPAGLTLDEFITLLRTGHDPDAPAGTLLQVVPWPVFGKKVDQDLKAIYEYHLDRIAGGHGGARWSPRRLMRVRSHPARQQRARGRRRG